MAFSKSEFLAAKKLLRAAADLIRNEELRTEVDVELAAWTPAFFERPSVEARSLIRSARILPPSAQFDLHNGGN